MKVVYVAKHDSGGADDEGAIAYALEKLGHTVERIHERRVQRSERLRGDFLLCHGWHDLTALSRVCIPRVFWYFDLVMYPDSSLAARCRTRATWVRGITDLCHAGFMTDGEWVAQERHGGKLHWLMQGVDERVAGPGQTVAQPTSSLLFTGIGRGGGRGREEFVELMTRRYGSQFHHVNRGAYRRDLANLIASTQIVVAPDAPVRHRYWSNRVYNSIGAGAFLIHPYAEGLAAQYRNGEELVFYHDRDELHRLIEDYLARPEDRKRIAQAGYTATLERHTYRHRCEELINVVKRKLGR